MLHVGIIDIGKTNAKVVVVNLAARSEVAVETRPNTVLPGPPWPHYDTEGLWSFVIKALERLHATHRIDAIAVTTHGACAALLDHSGALAAPVLDYEHAGPDETSAAYAAIRPPFSETGSPILPAGLNIGSQLYWMFHKDPTLCDRTAQIVTWPQYWGFRLTGCAATDVTSLGAHTDLWDPYHGRFSSVVEQLGLMGKMAPVHFPSDPLGAVLPAVAAQIGLDPHTPVICGIHDSNASLLPHLLQRTGPFAVVSTGTWVISMAVGGTPIALDPARDTLVNVNAFGKPVPSARFMGGREFDTVLQGRTGVATQQDVAQVLASKMMLLPTIQQGSGPFSSRTQSWTIPPQPDQPGLTEVAMGYYLALMTAECLAMIGATGPVLIEGPFARNAYFALMLATATDRPVLPSESQTGTALGAALLVQTPDAARTVLPEKHIMPDPGLAAYARQWRALVGG